MTDAGLRLSTLVDFDRLGIATGTALYFPGDRENGGVFKHAAMMATVAALKAAKQVCDPTLAADLADLAFFMIDKTLPYRTLSDPFVIKGNPRFCTQYNNSETGENIGPMLSGTATWLTLAVYEFLGADVTADEIVVDPVLPSGRHEMGYVLRLDDSELDVEVIGGEGRFRASGDTTYEMDGRPCGREIARPRDHAAHKVTIRL
jgi:cellobiose phosphorylase